MADDSEEYESLILMELSGIIDNDFLHTCEDKCKILGIETPNPVLQIGHYVFKGEYEDTIGTAVIFEDCTPKSTQGTAQTTDGMSPAKDHQPVERDLKFYDTTMKKLSMTRVFLSKKQDESDTEMQTGD